MQHLAAIKINEYYFQTNKLEEINPYYLLFLYLTNTKTKENELLTNNLFIKKKNKKI